jgi:hypothetical protein
LIRLFFLPVTVDVQGGLPALRLTAHANAGPLSSELVGAHPQGSFLAVLYFILGISYQPSLHDRPGSRAIARLAHRRSPVIKIIYPSKGRDGGFSHSDPACKKFDRLLK